jgi:hypothetical protein
MRKAALVLVVGVAFLANACSFVFVSGPPANHRQLPYFDCTSSKTVPILDTLWAGLQTANFALAVTRSDAEWDELFSGDPPVSRSTAIPLYLGLAALGVGGMYYGFTKTSKCRDAKAELMTRSMGGGMQPGGWPPPQPYPPAPAPYPPAPAPAPYPPAPAPAPAPQP